MLIISLDDHSYLAAGRLGKPQGPFVSERVLDVEVVRIVEDSDDVVSAGGSAICRAISGRIVAVVLELLAYGSQQNMKPGLVVRLALLESVGPAAAMLVLWVLPFRAHSRFEEVLV